MNSPDWSQIEEVFLAAAELSDHARVNYLAAACANHPELRAEVDSLLAAEEKGHGALTGAVNIAAEALGNDDLRGQRVCAWQLGELIGRTGGDDAAALQYYLKAVEVAAWLAKADAGNQLAGADLAVALMRAGSVLPGPEPIPQSIEYLKQAEAILADTFRKNPQVRFVRANLGLSSEYLAKDGTTSSGTSSRQPSGPVRPSPLQKPWCTMTRSTLPPELTS